MACASWSDKAIYFVLLDRFNNGDPSNDDFGKGEYSPTDDDCFQGGDLRGLTRKLPHIKALGFDAVWLTPPVHNQWINPYIKTRGFHGYWAYDFTQVDPHFGALEDYQRLVEAAHRLGLKVIQDIVVNHTGNFFTVDAKDYDRKRPEHNWRAVVPEAPKDPVFRLNNPNLKEHREAAVYNFTPNITDFKSREQTLTWSMGDLDDVNLKSPLAANRMKEIYRYWIEAVGVDGFRVDTVYYTPETFYEDFLYSSDPANLGVKRFAERLGKKDFFVFGEVWSYDYKAINRYVKDRRTARLDSAIDLPLNEWLGQVFYRKVPTEKLRKPLEAARHNGSLWVNFLDNHDVERMCGRAAWPAVQQSLVALFTLPGIPCVTYGTEAGFTASRKNMFAEEHYDLGSPQAVFLKKLIALRRAHPALSRGKCEVERTSLSCGLLSYTVTEGDEVYRVVFNTSPGRAAFDAGGQAHRLLLSSGPLLPKRGGVMLLPADSYLVLKESAGRVPSPSRRSIVSLKPLKPGAHKGRIELAFKVTEPERVLGLAVLYNDDFDRRLEIADVSSGTFSFDAAALPNGRHTLRLLATTSAGGLQLSNETVVTVRNPYRLLAKAPLPRENKGGLKKKVHAPAEASYDRQLSMENVEVHSSGRDLRLKVKMENVTADWNPPNGYDHVYFNVFFDFPGQPGKRFFPKMDYCREDFEFNTGFLLHGWGVRSFGAADSTPDAYGAPLLGEVEQAVDLKAKTITMTFSSRFFDSLKTMSGVRVFLSTWDGYLGDFRAIAGQRADWNFYTLDSDPKGLPKVFDRLRLNL